MYLSYSNLWKYLIECASTLRNGCSSFVNVMILFFTEIDDCTTTIFLSDALYDKVQKTNLKILNKNVGISFLFYEVSYFLQSKSSKLFHISDIKILSGLISLLFDLL